MSFIRKIAFCTGFDFGEMLSLSIVNKKEAILCKTFQKSADGSSVINLDEETVTTWRVKRVLEKNPLFLYSGTT